MDRATDQRTDRQSLLILRGVLFDNFFNLLGIFLEPGLDLADDFIGVNTLEETFSRCLFVSEESLRDRYHHVNGYCAPVDITATQPLDENFRQFFFSSLQHQL